ncbi:hypothetical protein QQF64_033470 [Cirrhinus molitorella]|uniref:Uncharacterized protein n=2 Tax=Cirrhinus molitorella TaxID=172907 RepID=A0AA88TSA7_9TELE|nr:hypothetical protein Q8A67_007014 [Cirrhinus molitorella]
MLEQMIIAMPILLTLFHAQLTESSSSCNLDKGQIREIIRVNENATASVSCPALEDTKITISLYKGDQKLHSTNLSDLHNNQSWQRFQVHKQRFSVSYKILRTKASDTGLYECKIDTEDTLKNEQSKFQLLLVKDSLHRIESSFTCPTDQTLPHRVGIGVSAVYIVFITVYTIYLIYKFKNTEPPENPYINTRPRGFRRR